MLHGKPRHIAKTLRQPWSRVGNLVTVLTKFGNFVDPSGNITTSSKSIQFPNVIGDFYNILETDMKVRSAASSILPSGGRGRTQP